MAYTDTAGTILRVTLAAVYPNTQVQETGFHMVCLTTGGGDTRLLVGQTISDLWTGTLLAHLSSNVSYHGFIVHTVETVPAPAPVFGIRNLNGTGAADLIPSQVRGLISWKTLNTGRAYRGRSYMFTPDGGSLGTDGELTVGYTTQLSNFASALIPAFTVGGSSWKLAIYHRRPIPLIQIPPTPVTTYSVVDKWATQRRGGDYGRPNANLPF